MTSKLSLRVLPLLLGSAARRLVGHRFERARGRTAHRLHRAGHRHLRPGRQGHGGRLPALSRRAQQQARRHGREIHRRGRPGQARHRRHQGQEADPARPRSHVHRRPARLDRLRAGAGQHRRKDAVHLVGVVGRRPDAAAAQQVSRTSCAPAGRSRCRITRSANGPATTATRRSSSSRPTMPSATRRSAASRTRSRTAAAR